MSGFRNLSLHYFFASKQARRCMRRAFFSTKRNLLCAYGKDCKRAGCRNNIRPERNECCGQDQAMEDPSRRECVDNV